MSIVLTLRNPDRAEPCLQDFYFGSEKIYIICISLRKIKISKNSKGIYYQADVKSQIKFF